MACRGSFWIVPLAPVMSRGVFARGNDVHVRLQLQLVLPGVVVSALGRAGRLLGVEIDDVIGVRDSGLLIEGQRAA